MGGTGKLLLFNVTLKQKITGTPKENHLTNSCNCWKISVERVISGQHPKRREWVSSCRGLDTV